jgi:hypothetical protein
VGLAEIRRRHVAITRRLNWLVAYEKEDLMVDFSRLSANWHRWAPGMGGGDIRVTTDCEDCLIASKPTITSSIFMTTGIGGWWMRSTTEGSDATATPSCRIST